jgi:PRC-barrel domain
MLKCAVTIVAVLTVAGGMQMAATGDGQHDPALVLAAGPVAPTQAPSQLSPEQKMQRRYPQPVKVGDLIGLPMLDDDDRTLGHVSRVVRTLDGKIQLIVSYGGFLGWGQRPVAVPIEVVAIAGRQLAALDMSRAQFDAAPAWDDSQSRRLPPSDMIRIGLYRR